MDGSSSWRTVVSWCCSLVVLSLGGEVVELEFFCLLAGEKRGELRSDCAWGRLVMVEAILIIYNS